MKIFIALACLLGLAAANDIEACHNSVVGACTGSLTSEGRVEEVKCNSSISGFMHAHSELQSYVNSHLASSYDYLLLGSYFDTYSKNRPGFSKLFKDLSDKAFDNAVGLIKHITKRGGVANFFEKQEVPSTISHQRKRLEVDELHALALVLDSEKKLANEAHHIHRRISHADSAKHYDPEISQYLEEEFFEYQTETIRKLSGYANDLSKLVDNPDPSLSIFLFDEYLQKQ